jgi:hypothetical protein
MSMSNQAVQSHSLKHDHNGTRGPPFRPGRKGRHEARKIRLTVSLPTDLDDCVRDAVYWRPSVTLAWLLAQSLRTFPGRDGIPTSEALPETAARAPRGSTSLGRSDYDGVPSCEGHRD